MLGRIKEAEERVGRRGKGGEERKGSGTVMEAEGRSERERKRGRGGEGCMGGEGKRREGIERNGREERRGRRLEGRSGRGRKGRKRVERRRGELGEGRSGEERREREVNGEEGKEIRSMVYNKPVLCVLIIILILLRWCQY